MSAQPLSAAAPAEHKQSGIPSALFGMVLFIASEIMFFGGFFGAYFDIRASYKVWPPPIPHVPSLEIFPIATLLTVILVTSSVTMQVGLGCIKRGDRRGLIRWMKVTLVLGSSFLALQLYDYAHIGFGLRDGVFATLFFTMTGFHFGHVFGGALFLYLVMLQVYRGEVSEHDHVAVEAATLYWHFVDVVWIGLFTTYYILR